ncbi:hypothetical protein V6N12_069735 [Hibiscus sabdariffa]|uniref:Endonuclease/exonuclease/phosphatase domain-containing protein n=1 Tax=Hibiscus sabdariffa TaxID=183260 RepID=A0ABR2FES3_9ROSI
MRALKDVLIKFNLSIVFLSETKKKKYLDRLKSKNKFAGSFYVEPRGLAGGLALWWKENVSITIMKDSVNFIDTLISLNDEEPWQCTFIYGPPHSSDKKQFWETFQQIRHCSTVNGVYHSLEMLTLWNKMIKKEEPRRDNDAITERIDKILISSEWSLTYAKAIGILEAAVASDHNPILLQLEGLKKKRNKAFKFESRWLLEEECHSNVCEAWEERPRGNGHLKLNTTRVKLKKWSGSKYDKSRKSIEVIKRRLLHLQKNPTYISNKRRDLKVQE